MADDTEKITVEDAKLDPTASTSRGAGISLVTWVMVFVILGVLVFGTLMIGGLLGPGMRNQSPMSNENSVAKP